MKSLRNQNRKYTM